MYWREFIKMIAPYCWDYVLFDCGFISLGCSGFEVIPRLSFHPAFEIFGDSGARGCEVPSNIEIALKLSKSRYGSDLSFGRRDLPPSPSVLVRG
jgi:hypothetical protein